MFGLVITGKCLILCLYYARVMCIIMYFSAFDTAVSFVCVPFRLFLNARMCCHFDCFSPVPCVLFVCFGLIY